MIPVVLKILRESTPRPSRQCRLQPLQAMQLRPRQAVLLFTVASAELLRLLPVVAVVAVVLRPLAARALAMQLGTLFSILANSTVSALLLPASSPASRSFSEISMLRWAPCDSHKALESGKVLKLKKFGSLGIGNSEVLDKSGCQAVGRDIIIVQLASEYTRLICSECSCLRSSGRCD